MTFEQMCIATIAIGGMRKRGEISGNVRDFTKEQWNSIFERVATLQLAAEYFLPFENLNPENDINRAFHSQIPTDKAIALLIQMLDEKE